MLIYTIIILFILIILSIGFYKKKVRYVEYEINLNNIDPEKGLPWYKDQVKKQIGALLFTIEEEKHNVIKYKAPLLYLVNEDYIEVDYDLFYIKIRSSKMVKKIMENRLEIVF